ncbi:AAA domain-containing protein [uncultured Nocardioides sp.]|uniref:DEAD/DEAH box helicase n=1 Tax=uncultured Nocardioides sp. TaxID=198441 RepID=UPI002613C309|nr:AAA domain-containing protein [uncultured Nocardioides sp.]
MPELGKHTLTRFLGSDCERQLKLSLSPQSDGPRSERVVNDMPLKQNPLPGLQNITEAGDEWAASRLAELDTFVGPTALIGARRSSSRLSGIEFAASELTPAALRAASVGCFLAEFQFEVGPSFQSSFDLPKAAAAAAATGQSNLVLKPLRPDLIEVRAPGSETRTLDARGDVHESTTDGRTQLRIIDIKLTSQPGPGYFAEVVYYSVALAGWLVDRQLDGEFVVTADPAIWPGSHEASSLRVAADEAIDNDLALSAADALAAVRADLVQAPAAVFVSSLQHFFAETLPRVLATPWRSLPYHVSQKCRGCDFLGDNPHTDPALVANNDLYCLQESDRTEHLSRIPFLGRGARELLNQTGSTTVSQVASAPVHSDIFAGHHSLRAQRTVISARAASVSPGADIPGGLVHRAGTSGMLPKWSDLNIYVTADFDSSSAITLALGVTGFYSNPQDRSDRKAWTQNKVFVVDHRSRAREEAVVLQFLAQIDEMVEYARARDTARNATARNSSQVQVYLWDELTYKHLCRVVSRHLAAILGTQNGVRSMAWLFPAEELVANERLVAQPVVSIVGDAIRSLITLPVPHHYSLLDTARHYHPETMNAQYADFRMPRHFEVPFSDQIPAERAHDVWNRGPTFAAVMSNLQRAVSVKLDALDQVTRRLRSDLRPELRREAARIRHLGAPGRQDNMTADQLLLYCFARLDAAVQAQEVARSRAMPAHEREAKFSAMRLRRRLNPAETRQALIDMDLAPQADLVVYEVRPESAQAKFKDGDYTCALVPEAETAILDQSVHGFVRSRGATQGEDGYGNYRTAMSDVLGVEVVKFDRDRCRVVVQFNNLWDRPTIRGELIASGLDLDRNVSIERVSKDYFTAKLKDALSAIGRTPKSTDSRSSVRALGGAPRPTRRAAVPIEDVLWDAPEMAGQRVERDTAGAQHVLRVDGRELDPSQWSAFTHALTHRLSLIWGPPGTGKSRTVVNVVAAAAWDAEQRQRPLRILVCANTYTAVDNVLAPIAAVCERIAPRARVFRGRSHTRSDFLDPPVIDVAVSKRDPGEEQQQVQRELSSNAGITILGTTAQQVYNFASAAAGSPVAPIFDLIVIDEAGQMDTANAILPLSTLAPGGTVIVAGDPLQLPPIHQVVAPIGAEATVGSIYTYLFKRGVASQNLLINYRSNAEIVELAHDADYPAELSAHLPRLRTRFVQPLPGDAGEPPGWPAGLAWSPALAELLNPDQPVTCVVYPDGLSGQSNAFEAQIVAGLTWILDSRLADNSGDPGGGGNEEGHEGADPYDRQGLLAQGLGVVTPHRAQQSEVIACVRMALPHLGAAELRDAVDTVERFQGQERDVIIASYAVGDPDVINDEDDFLLSLNRFNVMASRAKAQLIVLISEQVLLHLPRDPDVLWGSRMLKSFANTRCRYRRALDLPFVDENGIRRVKTVSARTTRF